MDSRRFEYERPMNQARRFQRILTLTVVASWVALPGCSCVPSPDRQQAAGTKSGATDANSIAAKDDGAAKKRSKSPVSSSNVEGSGSSPAGSAGKNSAGVGNSERTTGSPSAGDQSPEQVSASEARARGASLFDKANRLEREQELVKAFESALEGWQLVRQHPGDAECGRLEQLLRPLVERLGEAVNASYRRNPIHTSGKPTVIE